MEINERDKLVCEAYLVKPVSEVALEFGISESLVKQLVMKYKVKRKVHVQTSKVGNLGPLYQKLGFLLYYTREKKTEDRVKFAERLGWSSKKLAGVEKGTYQVTLLDMQDIASICGLASMEKLMAEIEKAGIKNVE